MGPKVRWFKLGRRRWIFKGDKIRSTTSFGREEKSAIPCGKILRHIKGTCSMKEILVGKIHGYFSSSFSCFTTWYLCCLLPESSGGLIRKDQNSDGKHNKSVMSQYMGRFVRYHPVNSNTSTYRSYISARVFSVVD
jgi:hypothetical protein